MIDLKAQLLDPAYRAKLLAIEAAASPAPWTNRWNDESETPNKETWEWSQVTGGEKDDMVIGLMYYDGLHAGCSEPNSAFIAEARNHLKAALELIGELSIADKLAWRYAHGEIEAACGGKTANMVRERVLMRREKIDAENEMRKAKP